MSVINFDLDNGAGYNFSHVTFITKRICLARTDLINLFSVVLLFDVFNLEAICIDFLPDVAYPTISKEQ